MTVSFSFACSLSSNQVVSDVCIVQIERLALGENKGMALMGGDPGSAGGRSPCRVPWPVTPAAAAVVEVAGPGGSSLRENWKLTVASVAAAFHLLAP